MEKLFRIRSKVNSLLEQARKDGVVKSSLSAEAAMSISTAATSNIIDLLGREEHTLKSLFGVSGVALCDRNLDTAPAWQYKDTLDVDGTLGPRRSMNECTDALCRYRDRGCSSPCGTREVSPMLDVHTSHRRRALRPLRRGRGPFTIPIENTITPPPCKYPSVIMGIIHVQRSHHLLSNPKCGFLPIICARNESPPAKLWPYPEEVMDDWWTAGNQMSVRGQSDTDLRSGRRSCEPESEQPRSGLPSSLAYVTMYVSSEQERLMFCGNRNAVLDTAWRLAHRPTSLLFESVRDISGRVSVLPSSVIVPATTS